MDDSAKLSIQINECSNNFPALFDEIQQRQNDALAQKKFDVWDKLQKALLTLNNVHRVIIIHELAKIENSKQMKRAIAGFAAVNVAIKNELKSISNLQSFVTALNTLLGNLNTAVTIALNKPASGNAG
jgi:hypothetical protein